ncbi:MAG: hypothetical protein WKF75_00245 [Singulisphaera sp.]
MGDPGRRPAQRRELLDCTSASACFSSSSPRSLVGPPLERADSTTRFRWTASSNAVIMMSSSCSRPADSENSRPRKETPIDGASTAVAALARATDSATISAGSRSLVMNPSAPASRP